MTDLDTESQAKRDGLANNAAVNGDLPSPLALLEAHRDLQKAQAVHSTASGFHSRRCFVISPIDQPGSEIRDHVDDVFNFIIEPATRLLKIHAHRADHNNQVGRITDQMLQSILKDDFCIALLTYQNPNVFYELAIAQAAARPVIILNRSGTPIPFDIHNLRVIEYDMRPRDWIKETYARKVVEMINSLALMPKKPTVVFGNDLLPLGRPNERFRFLDRVESFGNSDDWLGLMRGANRSIDLSGRTLRFWTKLPGFFEMLRDKAKQGCDIRVMTIHPDNPALGDHIAANGQMDASLIPADNFAGHAFFAKLPNPGGRIQIRQITTGYPKQQIVRIDDRMLVNLVLYSESTARSPLVDCTEDSPFFQTMLREFNHIWDSIDTGEPNAPLA
jgi:hypothetical protein